MLSKFPLDCNILISLFIKEFFLKLLKFPLCDKQINIEIIFFYELHAVSNLCKASLRFI